MSKHRAEEPTKDGKSSGYNVGKRPVPAKKEQTFKEDGGENRGWTPASEHHSAKPTGKSDT